MEVKATSLMGTSLASTNCCLVVVVGRALSGNDMSKAMDNTICTGGTLIAFSALHAAN